MLRLAVSHGYNCCRHAGGRGRPLSLPPQSRHHFGGVPVPTKDSHPVWQGRSLFARVTAEVAVMARAGPQENPGAG